MLGRASCVVRAYLTPPRATPQPKLQTFHPRRHKAMRGARSNELVPSLCASGFTCAAVWAYKMRLAPRENCRKAMNGAAQRWRLIVLFFSMWVVRGARSSRLSLSAWFAKSVMFFFVFALLLLRHLGSEASPRKIASRWTRASSTAHAVLHAPPMDATQKGASKPGYGFRREHMHLFGAFGKEWLPPALAFESSLTRVR